MNAFRVLGDLSHLSSKCILIVAIHRNKSAEGISLLTQILYSLVFVTRYLDLFTNRSFVIYTRFFKIFYILSSLYILLLMTVVYTRSRESGRARRLALGVVLGAMAASPFTTQLAYGFIPWNWIMEYLWTFSIILESVCVIPQLLLLRQTTVPTVINSFYLLALGMYRGLYILNWIVRWCTESHWDSISVVFGIVQTAFYIDFAWVYWSRQRVKLRDRGIMDAEDFRKGLLLNGVGAGRKSEESDAGTRDGDEEAAAGGEKRGRWAKKGISVSADEGLEEPSYSEKGGDVHEEA